MSAKIRDLEGLRRYLTPDFLALYELGDVIGRGAHGIAVKAFQKRLRRVVVLKFLSLDDESLVRRFRREAKLLADIRHANVVRLYDSGKVGELHYIALEHLAGETLARRSAMGTLDLKQIVGIAADVLAGLEAIHEIGVVHRDIKPANIMILPDGHATVIDLGVARGGKGRELTADGAFLGTPHYASPEQLNGEVVDPRSDLYSLGVVLLELLVGRNPFRAEEIFETVHRHAQLRVEKVEGSRFAPHPALEQLVVDLLQKAPGGRPTGAREALERLEAPATSEEEIRHVMKVSDPEILSIPDTEFPAPAPAGRLVPVGWPGMVLAFLVITVATGIVIWSRAGLPATAVTVESATAGPAPLAWDPGATALLVLRYREKASARRKQRIEAFSSPGSWNYTGVSGQNIRPRVIEHVLDFKQVDEVLQKIESSTGEATLTPEASCVLASLSCLRYMLWGELVGEKQLSFSISNKDFPRDDLAGFFRTIPVAQDTRSLFFFRKATQALERSLEDCLRGGEIPESFAEIPRMTYEIFWFSEGFSWTPEARGPRDDEYRRFEAALGAGMASPPDVVQLVSLSAAEGKKSPGAGETGHAAAFARILEDGLRSKRLPMSMVGQVLGGYAVLESSSAK